MKRLLWLLCLLLPNGADADELVMVTVGHSFLGAHLDEVCLDEKVTPTATVRFATPWIWLSADYEHFKGESGTGLAHRRVKLQTFTPMALIRIDPLRGIFYFGGGYGLGHADSSADSTTPSWKGLGAVLQVGYAYQPFRWGLFDAKVTIRPGHEIRLADSLTTADNPTRAKLELSSSYASLSWSMYF